MRTHDVNRTGRSEACRSPKHTERVVAKRSVKPLRLNPINSLSPHTGRSSPTERKNERTRILQKHGTARKEHGERKDEREDQTKRMEKVESERSTGDN